jgi:hypothetical protein
MMASFEFYPMLLNAYHRYLKDRSTDSETQLFNKINRIPETDPELLNKFRKGISFEAAVLKNKPHTFDPDLIKNVRSMLPAKRKEQHFVQFRHKNIRFYGFTDVLGNGRVIDLKTTSNYTEGKYAFNFQTLYLYALKEAGFKTMEYITYDFETVYHEIYPIDQIPFNDMLKEMEEFSTFLLENQSRITDRKIIQQISPGNLFE